MALLPSQSKNTNFELKSLEKKASYYYDVKITNAHCIIVNTEILIANN